MFRSYMKDFINGYIDFHLQGEMGKVETLKR